MIKKVNIALAVAFAALLAVKGLKWLKDSIAEQAGGAGKTPAAQQEASLPAPNVYYGFWAGYTLEDPISNRNGVLLDIVRAIYPGATFRKLHGNVDEFAKHLREDPRAVVVGFGEHPELKGFPAASTPLMHCPLVLMPLRSNPWQYKDTSSLDGVRIVADEAFLDYKVIRELRDRAGKDSDRLRLMPSTVTRVDLAEIVEKGEADAFVMSDMTNTQGTTQDGVVSTRILHRFRKSKPIANDGTLLYVSDRDADFAKRVIAEYEAGLRRIDENGQRRRIFEYYNIPYAPLKEQQGQK